MVSTTLHRPHLPLNSSDHLRLQEAIHPDHPLHHQAQVGHLQTSAIPPTLAATSNVNRNGKSAAANSMSRNRSCPRLQFPPNPATMVKWRSKNTTLKTTIK